MMPEEWPIAASAGDQDVPARAAGRGRLATVRVDFFLDPAKRLSEQERALMTTMLHCLVSDIADEIRAALPHGWAPANDSGDSRLIAALTSARLLDEPGLMALLLRRADEERVATAARARGGRREARALQGLVSHDDGAVSAAAMALILARGRRRDRFGQCLIAWDDLSASSAEALVQAIAAALRAQVVAAHPGAAADRELSAAARALLERRDPARSIDWLTADLVGKLDSAGAINDDLVMAAVHEGEIGFIAQVIARRADIPPSAALDELLSGNVREIMALLRIGGFSRELAAGIVAGIGDLLGIADAAEAIAEFDSLSDSRADRVRAWLGSAESYRSALQALGTGFDG